MNVARLYFLALCLFLSLSTALAAEPHQGTWSGPSLQVQLNPDGTYRWQAPGQDLSGTYQYGEGALVLTNQAGSIAFGFVVQGDQAQMVDMYGQTMVLSRQGGMSAAATAPAAPVATGLTAAPGSRRYLLQLLESYPTMAPDALIAAYQQLSPDQIQLLGVFTMVGTHMHLIMCQSPRGAGLVYQGESCAMMQAQYQQAVGWGVDVATNYENERGQLIISQKCQLGMIDAASCGTYTGVQQSIQQGTNQTTQTIIDNIGNQGCTQYYDQYGVYQGCW